MLRTRAQELIDTLGLAPHPEGGHYAETYRSTILVEAPERAPRSASTAIYYLLTTAEPASAIHRLRSDEILHLYEGGPLDVLLVRDASVCVARLGRDLAAGERPQLVIPAGTWFGAELVPGATHVLVGCTVAPGFDFADFELARGPELAAAMPAEAERIARMSRSRSPT